MADEAPKLSRAPARVLSEAALMQELGSRLVAQGDLTRTQLEDAASRATLLGRSLDQVLLDEQLVPEDRVLALLSEITGIPARPIAAFTITPKTIATIQAHTALHYRIVPVEFSGETLTIATSHPYDLAEQESMQALFGAAVRWVLCSRHDIEEALKHFYGIGADIVKDMLPAGRKGAEPQPDAAETGSPGIARLVNEIIREAIQMNASDIHIEPMEGRLSLRYRVDGVLCKIPVPDSLHRFHKTIVSALKVISQLNITERRLPQDGRLHMTADHEAFDIRVSILPTQHGEAVNLRILNRKATFVGFQDLGLLDDQVPLMEDLMRRPHGIALITGPTGSGKTTTLYATLAKIKTDTLSVVTIEDPVEYRMEGILQIQTNSEIGLDFAAGLRAVLRHDPNVILIGEIRDAETADIAIKSSLTGHLVFSTLHTNDSAGAIARLIDMGIEPYLVASSLQGVVAQRLVRRICASCAEPAETPPAIADEIRRLLPDQHTFKLQRGRGCPDCKYTGYRGRQAVFEILPINAAIRPLIIQRQPSENIQKTAVAHGMKTLRRNGWVTAIKGLTSAEEVLRVTQLERAG
jgi:type II secretory ATPase GspE/PulE/Tfp pilus assembly ATPase PilB-like protein